MTDEKKCQRPDRLAEQSLVARDLARSYDALPGMEQERLASASRQMWEAVADGKEERRRLARRDWLLFDLWMAEAREDVRNLVWAQGEQGRK